MKIVQINSFSNGSTGKIMMGIHNELVKKGYDSYVVWGRGRKSNNNHEIYMNNKLGVYLHALMSRLTGKTGFYSKKSTKELIKRLEKIKPDVVHLHNVHGYYINIDMLFRYLKANRIRVICTLHDCWSFTGQCPHFESVKCEKWKEKCYKCPMINEYPKSFVDNSTWNYNKKKEIFTGLDMTIVTPSKWLATLVKKSYLKNYRVEVINNGIDTTIFKPTNSDFRKTHNLENKKMILGVASVWDRRKGLSDFIKLSRILDDSYKIVLVGLSKKQIKSLPSNIIGITRTENQQELAGLYSTTDIFFNPTYEDNYPTVNIEAIACGASVITYNTGGSPEFIDFLKNKNFDCIINKNDLSKSENVLGDRIKKVLGEKQKINSLDNLNNKIMCEKYIELYNRK